MMQNPFLHYEIEKMRHEEAHREVRRYWELGLDKIEQPRRFHRINLVGVFGHYLVTWFITWRLYFKLRDLL